ncbi:MAG: hypothetical protein ACRCY3_06545 [Sphingorhabdus sp.]
MVELLLLFAAAQSGKAPAPAPAQAAAVGTAGVTIVGNTEIIDIDVDLRSKQNRQKPARQIRKRDNAPLIEYF